MLDSEALAIMRNLADGVKTYDQVVEVSPVSRSVSCVLIIPKRSSLHHCPMEEGCYISDFVCFIKRKPFVNAQ